MNHNTSRWRFLFNSKGMTLVEVMVMSIIVAITAGAILGYLLSVSKIIVRNKDRAFALEKCNQMLEEITAYSLESEDVIELDRFKDLVPNEILTADTMISTPDHSLSGNYRNQFKNWKYLRIIDVLPIATEPRARLVSVKVYYNDNDNPGQLGLLLAQLTKLSKTAGDVFPPTQVFDVYSIAIENSPGWWVDMSVMKPLMQNSISSIEARNPGLEYRVHWITRNGYGRDPYYRPYFNNSNDATASNALPYCYIYPSAIFGSSDFYYYSPDDVAGNRNIDGVSVGNPFYNYPLADYYNHTVRFPEEVRRYNAMKNAYTSSGQVPPEPPLSIFYNELYSNPDNYKNAFIFNLHGELIPLPPVRNYSDPAKDISNYPKLRVVSHPENMFYNDNQDLNIRVYAYYTTPDSFAANSTVDRISVYFPGLNLTSADITIIRMNGNNSAGYCWSDAVSSTDYQIETSTLGDTSGTVIALFNTPSRTAWNSSSASLPGYDVTLASQCQGSTPGNFYFTFTGCPSNVSGDATLYIYAKGDIDYSNKYYKVYGDGTNLGRAFDSGTYPNCDSSYSQNSITISKATLQTLVSNNQINIELDPTSYISGCTQNCTYVRLAYDTTATCGPGGLQTSKRLYGLEYIPCPVEAANNFSQDLSNPNDVVKNTARWKITIKNAILPSSSMISFTTFIGDQSHFNTPLTNRSETYSWRGIAPPVIEQLQILGDPRHEPYADIKSNNGYNWYFTSSSISSNYSGFSKNYGNLWLGETQRIDSDIPKIFMLIRHGIIRSDALWNAMTGYSYYYVAYGQEIGGDADNHAEYSQGIPMETSGWATDASPTNKVDEITSGYEMCTLPARRTGPTWRSFPWLGELYPDNEWSNWQTTGNLSDVNYYRIRFSAADWGGDYSSDADRIKRTQGKGCISFINGVPVGTSASTASTFTHFYYSTSSRADITAVGCTLGTRFKIPLPAKMTSGRPFILNSSSPPDGWPIDWSDSYYTTYRTKTELANIYYSYTTNRASAILNINPPTADANLTGHVGHILVNGLSPSAVQGAGWIIMYGLASMTQGFMDEGNTSKPAASRIHQLPRIVVTSPSANAAVPLSFSFNWSLEWKRWDGLKYSYTFASTFSESDPIVYTVKYSPDGGRHWFYTSDNTPALTGVRPDAGHQISSGPVQISFSQEGAYIVRVEAYRTNFLMHYSYHQIRVLALTNI